jgi:hypothetical protein
MDITKDAILVSGAIETAEVLDEVVTCKCDCGHEIQITGGVVMSGDDMRVLPPDSGFTTCPKCGGVIKVG